MVRVIISDRLPYETNHRDEATNRRHNVKIDQDQSPTDSMTNPLIIAHRGASAFAPENTLAAFRRAIDDGAEGIEFDVRLAKDGVPVVHHDANLRRTAGKELKISECLSTSLSNVDVGSSFRRVAPNRWQPDFAIERVPTLTETLNAMRDFKGRIFVELKCREGDVEPLTHSVADVLSGSPLVDQIIVKSFRLGFIPHLRTFAPKVRTAALFAPKIMNILRKEKHLVALAAEFGADELSIHYSLATKKLMKNAAKRGFPVTVWTVDRARLLKRLTGLGVDAVITNDPARMLELRDKMSD